MAGEELLIADSVERDRDGLRRMFDEQGYVCTAIGDVTSAQELVRRKHFPAAVIDLDFGSTNGGLDFVRFVQATSRPTRIVVLAGRRSFEAAVDALRLGVVDVVSKRPDQIEHLNTTVQRAIDLSHTGDKGGALMSEVRGVLEEALRIMFAMGRKLYGGGDNTSGAGFAIKPAILVIDEDQAFVRSLAAALGEKPWDVSVELSGGAGLDKASTFSFQIVVARRRLSDLPGDMLLRSAQAQQTQSLGIVYEPGPSGTAERFEAGRPTRRWPCTGAADVVRCIEELVNETVVRREERRYMAAFRSDHGAFLKRFADLKVRIDALTE
jgi:ActR/RegA family two-component response regulator